MQKDDHESSFGFIAKCQVSRIVSWTLCKPTNTYIQSKNENS